MRVELEVKYIQSSLQAVAVTPFQEIDSLIPSPADWGVKLIKVNNKTNPIVKETVFLSSDAINIILADKTMIWNNIPCVITDFKLHSFSDRETFLELKLEAESNEVVTLSSQDIKNLDKEIDSAAKEWIVFNLRHQQYTHRQNYDNLMNKYYSLRAEKDDFEVEAQGFKFLSALLTIGLLISVIWF
jgi:hypothetical protein